MVGWQEIRLDVDGVRKIRHGNPVKDSGCMRHAGKEGGLQKANQVFDFNRRLLKDAAKEGFKTSWKNSKGQTYFIRGFF